MDASDWVKNDSALSVEAIDIFHKSTNKLGLSKLECRTVPASFPMLEVSGVKISVSLDATVHKGPNVGGLLLLFSKAEASSKAREERCKTASVLAYLFAQQQLSHLGKPDHKLCFAVDVFAGKAHRTPSMYKTKLTHVQISCEEVALRWPTTKPPGDYDGPAWE